METVAVLILLALLFWAVFIYNRLVRDRNRVLAAWSDIDVQLKRRHDLIPKLVEAVRQYAAYEQSTLSALTRLRTESQQVSEVDRKGPLEQAIGEGVQQLLAVAEAYPELKANENFLALQREVSEVENQIQYARRYYNGAVRALNIRIDSFPDLILARLFGYRHAAYFVMEDRP
jgi:LemA protein